MIMKLSKGDMVCLIPHGLEKDWRLVVGICKHDWDYHTSGDMIAIEWSDGSGQYDYDPDHIQRIEDYGTCAF